MRFFLILFGICFSFFHLSAQHQIGFTVIDAYTKKPLKNAKVEIEGLQHSRTDREGKVFFDNLPTGSINIAISLDGYQYYRDENLKVTKEKNHWTKRLLPLPENSYYVQGKVTDEKGAFLQEVKVGIRTQKYNRQTISDNFGSFEFIFPGSDIKTGESYELNFSKSKYEDEFIQDLTFDKEHIRIDNIRLKAKKIETPLVENTHELIGKVVDQKTDLPITSAIVKIFHQGQFLKKYGLQETNQRGAFTVSELKDGINLEFEIEHYGYKTHRFNYRVAKSDAIQQIKIVMSRQRNAAVEYVENYPIATGLSVAGGILFSVGVVKFLGARNIYKDYSEHRAEVDFQLVRPEYDNRRAAYEDLEQKRKFSAWAIPSGLVVGIGAHLLKKKQDLFTSHVYPRPQLDFGARDVRLTFHF